MATKPVGKSTQWAVGLTALVLQPTANQVTWGWSTSDNTINGVPEKPTLQHQNAWQNNVYSWIAYLEQATDELSGGSSGKADIDSPAFTTKVTIPDGTVGVPGLGFTSDDDGTGTGIYRTGANAMGFTSNGTNIGGFSGAGVWTFGAAGGISTHPVNGSIAATGNLSGVNVAASGNVTGVNVAATGKFSAPNGTALLPSFSFTSDDDGSGAGLYRVGANSMGFTANGVNIGQYSAAGLWTIGATGGTESHAVNGSLVATGLIQATTKFSAPNGTVGTPSFSFTADDDGTGAGLYRVGANSLGFAANGVSVGEYASTGLWTIGNTGQTGVHNIRGALTATHDITAFSDRRLKDDIRTIDGAMGMIMDLRGVSYTRVDSKQKRIGLIAQEVVEVLPECVVQDVETGYLSVNYQNMIGLLVEGMKEMAAEIKMLKSKIAEG